jgi:flagellar assembly protein FliH
MPSAHRYLFDRSFETELSGSLSAAAPAEAVEVTSPAHTSQDLDRARAEGVALGRAEAIAECNIEREMGRLRQAALDAIAGRLGELVANSADASEHAVRDGLAIAATIARKLLPRFYRERACSELEELITRVLEGIVDAPKVTVHISPALVDELTPLIKASVAAGGHDQQLTILGDPAIDDGDCRIDWPGGGIIRDHALLWREIDALLADCAAGVPGTQSLSPTAD